MLLDQDLFWTSPLAFWKMPASLRHKLAQASLVFIKGDANYRRLLGDCHWSFTTSLAEVACYFPAPFVALRTLKSEVVTSIQPQKLEALNIEDPKWLINGKRGIIQFVDSL